jgi:flagellar hook-length control protein FliK
MSSQLIELLTINLKTKNKQRIKSTQNFILELLKNIEPKKAIDLLKNLHFTKDEIKEIISKLPQKDKKLYLELLNKEILKNKLNSYNKNNKKQTNTKTDLKNNIEHLLKSINQNNNLKLNDISLNINDKKTENVKNIDKNIEYNLSDNLSSKDNIESILTLLLNNTQTFPPKIKKEINNIKQDITQLIKKEIETNIKIENNLLTKKVITEIKNSNSFEELVSVANKNGLNIKKIITKIIKNTEPKKK